MFIMISQETAARLLVQDLLGQKLQGTPQPTMYAQTTPTFQ